MQIDDWVQVGFAAMALYGYARAKIETIKTRRHGAAEEKRNE